MKKKITADRARQLFSYNPETGALIRSVTTSSQAVAGSTPGWVNKAGYIALNIDAGCYLLHRVAWLITHGEWPCGVIDHKNQDKLDNRLDNLRWGTPSDNGRDSVRNGSNYFARKTHCPRGHELAGENLVASKLRLGYRECRACRNARAHCARLGIPFDTEAADAYAQAWRQG